MREIKVLKDANPAARNNPMTLEQYEPLIGSMSMKAAARASSIGMPLDSEDFAQELRIRFCDSVKKWDERRNASFINFFITAGWQTLNKIFIKYERRGHGDEEHRLDHNDSTSQNFDSSVGGDNLHTIIPSPALNPEEITDIESTIQDIRERLSDDTLAAFNMLIDPPDIVTDQFLGKAAGAELDREYGGRSRAYPEMNLRFISALFGLSQNQVARIKHELERACINLGEV